LDAEAAKCGNPASWIWIPNSGDAFDAKSGSFEGLNLRSASREFAKSHCVVIEHTRGNAHADDPENIFKTSPACPLLSATKQEWRKDAPFLNYEGCRAHGATEEFTRNSYCVSVERPKIEVVAPERYRCVKVDRRVVAFRNLEDGFVVEHSSCFVIRYLTRNKIDRAF
jgi:hypothetical protein